MLTPGRYRVPVDDHCCALAVVDSWAEETVTPYLLTVTLDPPTVAGHPVSPVDIIEQTRTQLRPHHSKFVGLLPPPDMSWLSIRAIMGRINSEAAAALVVLPTCEGAPKWASSPSPPTQTPGLR